ncbi:L-ascorbate metabolism protein UlaG (beta-lactamase superfamily) [Salegentibacter sp. 24]|uniref:MBL fold metallo-hydrolase n=1 Tax=Salegentibacter sp. 24 TaxID=2183986 RepID=UPI00106164CF|nr:MBL fold metallo-hydrolase [Salegentibacter sp. 24]TDN79347.1 L-ascorbate metabolism protein UlaG (beta-lactamase superfamily) [Salegentibacter sp. 24]
MRNLSNIFLLLILSISGYSQESSLFMRIVELTVEESQLSEFREALIEDIETAVNTEEGALEIYAVYEREDSTKVFVIETFASKEAHTSHQKTAHFLKYKNATKGMVKTVERTEVVPITLTSKLETGLIGKRNIQARPPATQPFGAEAFQATNNTTIRWLGNAGFLINSRGTTLMIDPLMQGFDMPLMIDIPISPQNVPKLDAVLITHADNDHYSIPTLEVLAPKTTAFHSTIYVDSLMQNQGFPSVGHEIGDTFQIENIEVQLTPADHAWQNAYPGTSDRTFLQEDSAGFWIETPDGCIWATGDSRLMKAHLDMRIPDAILFDFSNSEWHFTLEGAVKLANTYPNTPLLLHHWGTIDAPDFPPFNADPKDLYDKVVNPERIVLLAPGEPFYLKRIND